jgi:hypothetical protein
MKNTYLVSVITVFAIIISATSCSKNADQNVSPQPTASATTDVTVTPTALASAPLYTIGEKFGGGTIFYIDATGKHGLIAAPTDAYTAQVSWNYNVKTLNQFVLIGSTSILTGAGGANTTAIINKQKTGIYAALECRNYTGGGYKDWFLPSINELSLLYQKKAVIGNLNSVYWSSSEYAIYSAYCEYFNNGSVSIGNKTLTGYVRAVRAF